MPPREPTQPRINYNQQLDRIEATITETATVVNGQDGLLVRTARIEENLKTAASLAADAKSHAERAATKAQEASMKASELVGMLTINVTKLESTMATHIGTDHLSVLMKKKSFWVLVIVGFIALHIISTYVPNLWDFIAVLLGIPKLAIPLG